MGLYVRKVVTSSKATAVQIVSKSRGVRTIVEHVGSAHGEEQLAVLLEIARERIGELTGQVPLDLDGLGAVPPVTAAPTVAGSRSRMLWEILETAYARGRGGWCGSTLTNVRRATTSR